MSKLIPLLAIFAGLVMGAIVGPSAADELRIANDFESFVEARADVRSVREQPHRKGPPRGVVEYEFTLPNGKLIRGDNALTRFGDSPDDVGALVHREEGREFITVYYDPKEPTRSVIHAVPVWEPLGLIALSGFLLIGGTQAFAVDRRRRALQARADAARRR